jgi:hypothetical protein
MLEQYLSQLTQELELPLPAPQDDHGLRHLSINPSLRLALQALDPGFHLSAVIGPCPAERREDLFILLMRANFLGQGTGEAVIGLDREEKLLTLSLTVPYEVSYKAFKERVEDFANYIDYWREELENYQKTARTALS